MAFVDAPSEITILPALGQALIAEGDKLYTFSAVDDEPKPFHFEDYSRCAPGDLLGLQVPNDTTEESLRVMVQQEKDRNDVVFFFLASLDRTLSLGVREEAASMVETLIADDGLYQYAEEVLLSEPFGATENAVLELSFPSLEKYTALISQASAHQFAMHLFWQAWNMLTKETDSLSLSFDLDSLRDLLLSAGLISKFVRSIQTKDLRAFNTEIVNLTMRPEVRDQFGTAAQLLTKLRNFLDQHNAFSTLQMSFNASAVQSDTRDNDEEPWSQQGKALFDYEIYSQIIKQINSIKPLLFTGSRNLVDRAVRELLEFQKLYSEPEYLAKTLCNLAQMALEANEIEIARDLSDQASALGVHDPVVDSTAAEVMKNLGQFADAKALYEAAIIKFGNERYLLNGLADVLKEYGDYKEAVSIYQRAELEFPEDPVAANGLSTVYFAMGHSEQALAKARNNVMMFGDIVSRIICGNILRHLGRNHESLSLMHETVAIFPRETIALSGYIRSLGLVGRHQEALKKCEELIAEVPDQPMPKLLQGDLLRKFGSLSESLVAFNKALVQFPSHRGLLLGKASVLLLLGDAEEAARLTALNSPQSELDWRMFHIYSSSFVRLGNYPEALSLLQRGLENVPWRRLRSLFSDTIGYVRLRMGDARTALSDFRMGLRTADRAKRNGLYLLLGRAYQEIGNYKESARYINDVMSNDPPVRELKAARSSGLTLVRHQQSVSAKTEQMEFQMLLAAA